VKFAGVGDGLVNEYDGKFVAVDENKGVVAIGPDDDKMPVDVEFLTGLVYVATGTGTVVVDTTVPGSVTVGALDVVVGVKP
jgi:hypothetical protein